MLQGGLTPVDGARIFLDQETRQLGGGSGSGRSSERDVDCIPACGFQIDARAEDRGAPDLPVDLGSDLVRANRLIRSRSTSVRGQDDGRPVHEVFLVRSESRRWPPGGDNCSRTVTPRGRIGDPGRRPRPTGSARRRRLSSFRLELEEGNRLGHPGSSANVLEEGGSPAPIPGGRRRIEHDRPEWELIGRLIRQPGHGQSEPLARRDNRSQLRRR